MKEGLTKRLGVADDAGASAPSLRECLDAVLRFSEHLIDSVIDGLAVSAARSQTLASSAENKPVLKAAIEHIVQHKQSVRSSFLSYLRVAMFEGVGHSSSGAGDMLLRFDQLQTYEDGQLDESIEIARARGSRQNYLVLFDAIDSMEEYDEDLLRKKLKKETFLKQIAVYKVYLFNLILKALHQYGAQDKAEAKLTDLMINIKILISRALFKEAGKLIKKAKELAYKYDKLKVIHELLGSERNLLFTFPDKNIYTKRKQIFKDQTDYILKLNEFFEFSWLVDRMTILVDHQADFNHSQKNRG